MKTFSIGHSALSPSFAVIILQAGCDITNEAALTTVATRCRCLHERVQSKSQLGAQERYCLLLCHS